MTSKKSRSPGDGWLTIDELARSVHRDRRTVQRILVEAGVDGAAQTDGVVRYDPAVVKPILDSAHVGTRGAGGSQSLRDQKLVEEIRRLKIANDAKLRRLVERDKVEGAFVAMGNEMRSMLRQKLEIEWPAQVAGLDIAQARVYGARLSDEIMRATGELGRLWDF